MNHHEQSEKSKESSKQRAKTNKKPKKKRKTQIKKKSAIFFEEKKSDLRDQCENKLESHRRFLGTRINDIGKREKRTSLFLQFFKRTTRLGRGKVPPSTRARTLLCKTQAEQSRLLICVAVGGARNKSKGTNPKRVKKSVYW